MASLPSHRPRQLSLGPLETEILALIWRWGTASARHIHEQILSDPDRELAYASVMTVLQRLQQKGWVRCDRNQRPYSWQATVSEAEAAQIWAHERLESFLSVSNPDIVAAFADSLDAASVEQLDAIVERLRSVRQQREQG